MTTFTDPSVTRLAINQLEELRVIEHLLPMHQNSVSSLPSVFD
jgi:hypothetical protein